MALPVRKSYKGAPVNTTLSALLGAGSTSCTVGSVTGWPTTFPFYVVIEPGTSREEKVKVTAATGTTLTIVRAQDNTTDVEHPSASTVYPVFTAIEADEANQVASAMTTKGDLITTDGSSINRLAVGATNTHVLQVDSTATNGIKWGQVATAGIADSAVTSAKIADGTIVDADINASAAIALSKLATGALPTAITVASANLVDGTIVDADISASAAIALSKLATGALPTAITVASANLVDGTIATADIANSAVTTAKIADAAITTAKLAAGVAISGPTGPTGPTGATGPQGATGAQGATGSSGTSTWKFGTNVETVNSSGICFFAHGVGATPSTVLVCSGDTGVANGELCGVSSWDSTNIYVEFPNKTSGSVRVNWIAIP